MSADSGRYETLSGDITGAGMFGCVCVTSCVAVGEALAEWSVAYHYDICG